MPRSHILEYSTKNPQSWLWLSDGPRDLLELMKVGGGCSWSDKFGKFWAKQCLGFFFSVQNSVSNMLTAY